MLDIRWLEDLLVLAETRSFRRAAELRHVTQSGLSRRIQSLEHWAAVPLVNRDAVPLELTEHGKALAAVADDVVWRLRQQRLAFAERSRARERRLTIVAPGLLSFGFFPHWLPRLEQALGDVSLTMQAAHLPQCRVWLDEGKADLVVCLVDRAGVIARRIQPSFAPRPEHRIVIGHETLTPLSTADERGEPRHVIRAGASPVEFISHVGECALSWAVDELMARRGIRIKRRRENSSADGVRGMALAGMGVAWLPDSTTARDRATGALLRAGDSSLDIHLDIVAVRGEQRLSPLAEKLWHFIAEDQPLAVAVPSPGSQLRVVGSTKSA